MDSKDQQSQIRRDMEQIKRMQQWLERARAMTRKNTARLRQLLGRSPDSRGQPDLPGPGRKGDKDG
jgi:hypothetical protein